MLVNCDQEPPDAPAVVEPQAAPAGAATSGTYGQILKSSALIGGSQALNVAIGIVRTKAMAVLLGPAGYGLFGLYGSVAQVVQSVAGMGVGSSGVRQIAASAASGDTEHIALTTVVLRRTSLVLVLLGALLMFCLAKQISAITFGTNEHAAAVRLLSAAVFFQVVSWGQDALVQGLRRIADLAKMQVLGALFGLLLSVPLVYVWREKGVVPALVGVALMYLAVSWRYSRKIRIHLAVTPTSEITQEASALLKLGFVFMITQFMTMGVAYGVRIIILRTAGFAATGYYQSAWTIGGLYVGFILQAMGADFYPRLTGVADDNFTCNRLVNEQTQVGLLLAGTGALATLALAPIVISIFYSAKFGAAVGVLRWMCLGASLQVITWPLGYMILAKGRKVIYFFTQLAWIIASLALAYVCVAKWGLSGAGIAFFASYVFFGLMDYAVVRRLSGFRWSRATVETTAVLLSLIAITFGAFQMFSFFWAACIGAVATFSSCIYSIWTLSTLISWNQIPRNAQLLLSPFRSIFLKYTLERGEQRWR